MSKTLATAEEIQLATERHCYGSDDEIELDEPVDGTRVSRGEDGVWVAAWVFVPKELIPNYQTEWPT